MAVSVAKVLTFIFGRRNAPLLKRYQRIVSEINSQESKVSQLSDEQLRARTQEIRAQIAAKKLRIGDVIPEALAIMRESMDRHIGIREVFNPEQNFNPSNYNKDQLDDKMYEVYDLVQQRMIQTGEPWQKVPIPVQVYDAVRKLFPESRPPFRARCFDVQMI